MACACPAGHECRTVAAIGSGERSAHRAPAARLPLRRGDLRRLPAAAQVRARPGPGRLVMLHPQEALLQEARAFQRSAAFAPYRPLRQAAEHRLARLMQLGLRQARYVGRAKTLCQLLLAATVANLTLVATDVGLMRDRNHIRAHPSHQLGGLLTTILSAIWLPFAVGTHPTSLLRGRFSATLLGSSDRS